MSSQSRRPLPLTRREVVGALGALGLSACGRPAKLEGPFPLGVASGDATSDGAVLWTLHAGVGAPRVAVWEGDGERPADALVFEPTVNADGFATALVTGLGAGRWHRFRFEAVDEQGAMVVSEPGRFRTALAPNALEKVTLGAVSCTKHGYSFATLARAAENSALDAFVLLGDVVYTDGSSTVADYRARWAETIGTREYRALRASTSLVTIWDDHEVRNNWEGDTVASPHFDAARTAFVEHQPMRLDLMQPGRFWRKLSWGRTVDLFVLDSRSERNRAAGEYLSRAQADWLTQGIAESQAAFKLVLNTVPIGAFDTAFFQPFKDDMWQAFPEQRRAVLDAIDRSGARGVVWVSGDFHLASVGRVSHEGPGASALEVLVGPGAQAANALPSYPAPPMWDFSSGINNYVSFELDPAGGEAVVRYHDGAGRVFFERGYRP